jgi:hypothetical protein
MSKNPLINACAAVAYIALVASVLFYVPPFINVQESVLIPIAVLSLFVFSAACMGYIFLYQPLQLFLEGHKKESVDLFLKTLGFFALVAALFVALGLYLTTHGTLLGY